MPAIAIIVPDSFSSPSRAIGNTPSIDKLITELIQHKDLAMIKYVARAYEQRLKTCRTLAMSLIEAKKAVFLLDCDVILSYLNQTPTRGEDVSFINYLFRHSTAKYAIPAGAFAELMPHFEEFQDGNNVLRSALDGKATATKVFADLTTRLLRKKSDRKPGEAIKDLDKELDKMIERLCRLRDLTSTNRFLEVIHTSSGDAIDPWYNLIRHLDRNPKASNQSNPIPTVVPRDDRDRRDAKNLAITSRSDGDTRYVLVTFTSSLLRLKHTVREDGSEQVQEAVATLCEQLRTDTLSFPMRCRILRPQDAMAYDMLVGMSSPITQLGTVSTLRKLFRQLEELIDGTEEFVALTQSEALREVYNRYVQPEQKALIDELGHYSDRLAPTNVREKITKIEQLNETVKTTDGDHEPENDEEDDQVEDVAFEYIREKASRFSRIFDEFLTALAKKKIITYYVVWQSDELHQDNTKLREFGIKRSLFESDWHVTNNHDGLSASASSIMGHQVLKRTLTNTTSETSAATQYVALYWPIGGPIDLLMQTLPRLFEVTVHEPVNDEFVATELLRADLDKCLIVSNVGNFSISLDFARGPGDWSNLDANYLRSRIAEQIGKDEDAIFLNRIQISTKYLDIYYDLRPSEYYFERRCTVETKYQIETVVADLFQGTSMEFCVPQRLTQVLETVMSPLEALPSTEKRRRNYVFNDGSEL